MRRPSLADYLVLILLAAVWGSGFLFIKVGVETIPPATLTAARIVLGALALTVLAKLQGQRFPRDRASWLALVAIGVLSYAAPLFLISWGEQYIDSGRAALLMSASPFFAIFLAHRYLPDDRFTWAKLAGALLGFGGILVLVGTEAVAALGSGLRGSIAVVAAAFCFPLGSLFVRRIAHVPVTVAGAASLYAASVPLIVLGLAAERPWTVAPSALSLGAIVYLSLVTTAFATVLRLHLIHRAGVTFLSQVSYLIPVFGLVFGIALLGEPMTVQAAVALALVLAGIWVSRAAGPPAPPPAS